MEIIHVTSPMLETRRTDSFRYPKTGETLDTLHLCSWETHTLFHVPDSSDAPSLDQGVVGEVLSSL